MIKVLATGARMLWEQLKILGLSPREADVAHLVSRGLSNKDVASQLFVTEKTVKFHLTNIYKKMQIKSRAQLVVWCMPHLSFEEKKEWSTPPKPVEADDFSMPVGINKVGSA